MLLLRDNVTYTIKGPYGVGVYPVGGTGGSRKTRQETSNIIWGRGAVNGGSGQQSMEAHLLGRSDDKWLHSVFILSQ